MAKIINAQQLMEMEYPKDTKVWGDFMIRGALNAIIGGSDTGKSTLLRLLGLAVARGDSHFLGFPLSLRTKSALIVSIEDGMTSVAEVFQERYRSIITEGANRLDFMFELEEDASEAIGKALEVSAYDIVFIDCYSDAYTGRSGNDQMETKRFLKQFDTIAKKHDTAIVFLHHLNKSADESRVSKGDATGSAAFEQKMRSIVGLTKDGYSNNKRYLKIVKGNYASNEAKQARHVLEFDQSSLQFRFISTKAVDAVKEEISTDKKKQIVKFLIDNDVQVRGKGLSFADAPAAVFETFGVEKQKGALHAWVNQYKSSILAEDCMQESAPE